MQRTVPWTLLMLILSSYSGLSTDAKTVVFIPPPALSLVKCHANAAHALSQLGHKVWLAMSARLATKGFGLFNTTNISVIWYDPNFDYLDQFFADMADSYFKGTPANVKLHLMTQLSDVMLRNQSFVREIQTLNPDLIVLDNVPSFRMMFVFPYKLDVPFAILGFLYDVHTARIPHSPAVTPFQFSVVTDHMTFFQRVKMVWMYCFSAVYDPVVPRGLASIYAPDRPYISNDMLFTRAEIWLLEIDHILDYPRPTLPNVKLIGGTATGPARPLPPEFQSFIDNAPQGVVIVTFGSVILGVPKDISDKLFKVFLRLPMKVIFRSNLTSPDPAQVMTSQWLPQNDLLGHGNTKVFVSHCGKNGQYEALYHAVPLVCTPICVDQHYNSERIRVKGFGEGVDLRTVTEDELFDIITTVSKEPRYKAAINKASMLFRQQYGDPKQEAAKWLDHVMQHGGEYMRSAGQKIPVYQFLMLDVFAFALFAGILAIWCLYFCVRSVWRWRFGKKPKVD